MNGEDETEGQREYLRHLLPSQAIVTRQDLRNYIDLHYGKKSKIPFQILKGDDADVDDENRICKPIIDFEQTIFDVPKIRLLDSGIVRFVNCIFTGQLEINRNVEEVIFDYCIVAGPLWISHLGKETEVSLSKLNTPELNIIGAELKTLHMAFCRIAHLTLDRSRIRNFATFSNRFDILDVGKCDFEDVSFEYTQVPLEKQTPLPDKKHEKQVSESLNEFDFLGGIDYDGLSDTEGRAMKASTMRFLLKYSNAYLNRDAFGHAKYLLALASQKHKSMRRFYQAIGALIKPWRIGVAMCVAIAAYGAAFAFPCFQFNVADAKGGKAVIRSLTVPEALYYSGVSFTTIGYGDITPNGFARPLAVSEAVLGVTLAGAFLVALTRKYVE